MAAPPKPKGPASDLIMTSDKMKPLLALSKREPVQAAIGLTSDGDGLILLDKKAKPKKVFAMLKAEAGKAKLQLNMSSLRFGRAEVDTDYDSGMVRFFINKDAPGNMRMKLVEVVKRIPYQKVEINIDPSLEEEAEEGEAEEADASAAGADAVAPDPPPPPPPAAAPTPEADPKSLAAELAGLLRRVAEVPGTNPAKPRLVKLATDANVQIKTNNLTAAADFIGQLRTALDEALAAPATSPTPSPTPSPTTSTPPSPKPVEATKVQETLEDPQLEKVRLAYRNIGPALKQAATTSQSTAAAIADGEAAIEAALEAHDFAAAREQLFALVALSKRTAPTSDGVTAGLVEFAKLRLDWDGAKSTVGGHLAELRQAIEDDEDDEDGPVFATAVAKLGEILATFSEGLGDSLDALANASDPGRRETLRAKAGEIGDRYLTYLTSSPLVKHVDANPYDIEVGVGTILAEPLNRLKTRLAAIPAAAA